MENPIIQVWYIVYAALRGLLLIHQEVSLSKPSPPRCSALNKSVPFILSMYHLSKYLPLPF